MPFKNIISFGYNRLKKGLRRTKTFAKKWTNFRSYFANVSQNFAFLRKWIKQKNAKTMQNFAQKKNSAKTNNYLCKNTCGILSSEEWGKAGGHKPQHFPLQCHILSFLSSGSHEPQPYGLPWYSIWVVPAVITFLNDKFRALKM